MTKSKKTEWTQQWNCWIAPTRFQGVWRRREGGHLVRARVHDPIRGKLKEIRKVLPDTTDLEALTWLETERHRIRNGQISERAQKKLFGDYAVSLFEAKLSRGDLKSASSQDRWKNTLEHLIGGTSTEESDEFVVGLGDVDLIEMRAAHLERWRDDLARLVMAGHFAPTTINSWFSILRVILRSAARDHELPRVLEIDNLDTSEHVTYTEEEPNALAPEDVPRFLEAMLGLYPQHYAMTYLGFATGLRPSSLRPIRRSGLTPDLVTKDAKLHVRRSHTMGQEVMGKTKTALRYSIHLPMPVMEVLNWHIETQLKSHLQKGSELLFPSEDGRLRSATVLKKPFDSVVAALELPYAVTPRGMRRTFQDLARTAQVPDLVTRSVSGHATVEMQRLYSTVRGEEQRAALLSLVDLFNPSRVGS